MLARSLAGYQTVARPILCMRVLAPALHGPANGMLIQSCRHQLATVHRAFKTCMGSGSRLSEYHFLPDCVCKIAVQTDGMAAIYDEPHRGVPHLCNAHSGKLPKATRPRQLNTEKSDNKGSCPSFGPCSDCTNCPTQPLNYINHVSQYLCRPLNNDWTIK